MSLFKQMPVAVEAHVHAVDVKQAHACGRSQNWMPEYVAKANNGGIERVLV